MQAEIRLMPELMQSVAESDVVFAASAAEHILIHGRDLDHMPAASSSVGGVRRCESQRAMSHGKSGLLQRIKDCA